MQRSEMPDAAAEVVELVRDMIRIDSTNFGDDSGPGESAVAEYVQGRLAEAGISAELFTTTSSKRGGVFARIPGSNPDRPALLVHGHLDVVPAPGDWQLPPFSGEVHDGMVWGRGAVDMKDGDGMILAVARHWARSGFVPPRDIHLLFLPDEEAGGRHGAHWLVDNRPEMFENVSEAVGEVGGFSFQVSEQRRLYLIQTAEKGIRWMRLTAHGKAGHGSLLNEDNAVVELAKTLARIGQHEWPTRLTATNRRLVAELNAAFELDLDVNDVPQVMRTLGPMARMVGATFQNTAQPTMLNAGYKVNVIPGEATAQVDGRVLPGFEQEFDEQFNALLGANVVREDLISDIALETDFEGDLVSAMTAALAAEDPQSQAVPYLLSGGTDAKAFARLGIRCFGFMPLQLPPELDFWGLFHGVDERVPVSALEFGARTMDRFLRNA